ncbi:unnamed protein product [Fusarium graminearum]|uniref:Chromosome 1, complete genome n=1 Tax=Gibberella zeae (strain ATCC MYA-4620 / CBS 123657 / FGSC 9075 / NRRL 31084 / PH-1) TaxID=229533 RepID=I1RAS1_GIBZE|nr:hypothetical protein FGSG_00606 [Fusarium graminearum PH-1]ESU05811.1 hypothetical protein FGSG_00606 [Fusarium graminearum PH-1]CEF72570.1 unnamed protein product [Fusarium graminearum]CZS75835.1 unnamed protein product [Fusarium graminearum]|eukprot:XP_011316296.1 hypothetical protein FGSG_00606 [Fusarium graminearum PH-1]
MSRPKENQATVVAGRRQEECPKVATLCPAPRGEKETQHYSDGGSDSLVPQARDNAQYEIDESRQRQPSALKNVWRFFSTPQPSPYPQDRRGRTTRLDESQMQPYWNTPFRPESPMPPVSDSTIWPFSNDSEPEEVLDIEIIAWNRGPRRTVRIVHGDPRQAVQPAQAAIIVGPSTDDSSSAFEDESYEEEEEEDIVVQARRVTRVGRATLIKLPELNRNQNQNQDVQESRPPSVDLADC